MQYDGSLIVVMNIYSSPVIIDRLPGEGPSGFPIPPPYLRYPGMSAHVSQLAEIFPLMVEPSPGGRVKEQDLAGIIEDRLADPISQLMRFPKIRLKPENSVKDNNDDK